MNASLKAARPRALYWSLSVFAALAAALLSASASATPYSVVWDGSDWPENQGWTHTAYDAYGGPPGTRELANGEMHLDGTASAGIVDFQSMYYPGLDCGPGEEFVMSWRVRIDEVLEYPWDCEVGLVTDDAWLFIARFGMDNVRLPFEANHIIPFAPNVYHDYEFRSYDMRSYSLKIDGTLEWEGALFPSIDGSYVGWGDSLIGSASASTWDRFTFGVVPEPGCILIASVLATCARRRSLGTWRSHTKE